MGYSGTSEFRKGCGITKAGVDGLRTQNQSGLHPIVKAGAQKAVTALKKYSVSLLKNEVTMGGAT